jgi:hypothetical protein
MRGKRGGKKKALKVEKLDRPNERASKCPVRQTEEGGRRRTDKQTTTTAATNLFPSFAVGKKKKKRRRRTTTANIYTAVITGLGRKLRE